MKKLKIKLFFRKRRKVVNCILLVLFTLLAISVIKMSCVQQITVNQTTFAVIGTLLGALIGGFFSLYGSILVNFKQQRRLQNINRKNVIYSPLYDELVDIQDNILIQNPYPDYILFKKSKQTIRPHPQFTVWGEIKLDSRYLEVPDILSKQMDKLESAIINYSSVRANVNSAAAKIFNTTLSENDLPQHKLTHIGSYISQALLAGLETDVYDQSLAFGTERITDELTKQKINSQIFEKANHDETILDVRQKYTEWLKIQKETIELLSLLIRQIIQEYES